MSPFNPSLGGYTIKTKGSFNPLSIRISSPQKDDNNKQKRATRSDKKKDIKVPITIQQKQKLMLLSKMYSVQRQNQVSITQVATELVEKGLLDNETFPSIDYVALPTTVHVKLTSFYVDQLFNFQLEWTTKSIRESAARVLYFMLENKNHDEEI